MRAWIMPEIRSDEFSAMMFLLTGCTCYCDGNVGAGTGVPD
jgi:hypothetical protein